MRKVGHLNFGFKANTSGARGGLGSDVRDYIVWLRSKANALSSAETKSAFAVVCFGTNALIRGKTDERLRKDTSSTADLCLEAVTDEIGRVLKVDEHLRDEPPATR